MDNVKVCASFILPGRVRPVEYPYSKNGKNVESNVEYYQQTIKLSNGKTQIINLIKPTPAKQSLKIGNAAFNEMVNTPVSGVNVKHWNSLNKALRIKAHLMEIAQTLNGELESFEIMKD